MDALGTKIQASITSEFLSFIQIPLVEGCLYHIRDALVLKNDGKDRPTCHPFRLVIQGRSVFFKIKHKVFNKPGLTPLNTSGIACLCDDVDHLIDTVGILTSISTEREYVMGDKEVIVAFLEIANPTGKVECVLCDDYVQELREYLETNGPRPPIVVVQSARILPSNQLVFGAAGIETISDITKVLFSPDMPEVYEMINWLAMTDCPLEGKLKYMYLNIPDEDIRHEFPLHHPRKTIAQLTHASQLALSVIWATIIRLADNECWWFTSCKHLTWPSEEPLVSTRDCFYSLRPRFNVKVEVFDGDESTFLFWGMRLSNPQSECHAKMFCR